MGPTREQKLEKYKKLPDDLKETIMSVGTSEKFYAVGQKHQLNIEQVEILSKQAGLVMLGFEHPSKFIGNIAKALDVPEERARAIAQDVNAQIFQPVRESLKKIHGIEPQSPPPKPTIPPPSPTTLKTPPPNLPAKPLIAVTPKLPVSIPPTAPIIPKPPLPPPPTLLPSEAGKEENEADLNREEILAGIENPVPAKPTGNIVQEKLDGLVRMPKTEQEIKEPTPPPAKPNYTTDPYREPV